MTEIVKERVGDYELLDLIGDGAQGRVYKARYIGPATAQFSQDEIVAIKLIRITGDDDKVRIRFRDQADILRRLSHANIVRYRDSFGWHSGEWDEAQCLVMEYLDGETLADCLKRINSGLPWAQVEDVFEQCLAGLIHARERGITHRDLKASNIFIAKDGQVKVIDFDIARQDDGGQVSTAGWKGTFDYMAPDFITIPGFRGDEASDVFSLGVCFYQALTGRLPYEGLGESAHIGYLNRWKDGAAPAPSFKPSMFRVLSNAKPFVSRCLAVKREQRYATFAAMLEDFRKIRARRIRHKNKDEYELIGILGHGGFGEVFKARRVSDGMLVAVKHLFAEKQSDRFVKEAKILQQYPHPNLVKYIDFMIVEGMGGEKQYFLILEFLEGMPGWTLRARLKNEGRLEVAEALPLFAVYLAALQFMHENSRPIIHRDIKPGNLYAPAGQPGKGKIFDLGVARDVSGTVTVGGVPGTLDYMPPEFSKAGGDRGSPQSDIYALGLCLFESLSGKPVYDRLPADMNAAWIAFRQRLRKPLELSFDADAFRQYPRIKGVILKALAPRPDDRYRSAAVMRQDIENILAGVGVEDSHGDESESELTMATLQSFVNENEMPVPEPGATVGTRPLDAGGETRVAPVNLIAAGKAEAKRRQRRRVWLAGGVGLVLFILVVSVGNWLTTRMATRQAAASLPVEFRQAFEAAIGAGKLDKAGELRKEWRASSKYCEIMGLTEERVSEIRDEMERALQRGAIDRELAAIRKSVPDVFLTEESLERGEAVAVKLRDLKAQPWKGFEPAEKQRRLEAASASLVERAVAYLVRVRDAALAKYRAGLDGEAERDVLNRFAVKNPVLTEFVQGVYSDARNGVEAARQSRITVGGVAKIIDGITNARDGEAIQMAIDAFLAMEKSPEFKLLPAQVKLVEDAVAAKHQFFAAEQARLVKAAYDGDRWADGQREEKSLALLVAKVPDRFGRQSLASIEKDVEASRLAAEARRDQVVLARKSNFDEETKALAELRGRIGKGNLEACVDGGRILSVNATAALSDVRLKTVWDSAVSEYARLIERTLLQKDPLAQRVRRVKVADEVLNDVATEQVLAGHVKSLREILVRQKGLYILQLNNKSGEEIRVSSRDLSEKWTVSRESVRELELPVRSPSAPVSLLIEGGADSKSRIESVSLVGAGGGELVIAVLEKVLPKEAAPVSGKAPDVGEAPVAKSGAPATTNTAAGVVEKPIVKGEKPTEAATRKGVLEVSVTPRTSVIKVDGNIVKAGRVEVLPDENHKVQVDAVGYKPFLQYYRVRAGDVRKMEIFLEKDVRRSLFWH